MNIGFQGIEASNSEEAAKLFANKLNIKNANFIPLTTAQNVADKLKGNEIDFGVFAIRNKLGGEVIETKNALKGNEEIFQKIDTLILKVHHSVFKKSKDVKEQDLKIIASHIQALLQTKNFRKAHFSSLQEMEVEDTAIAAKYLAEGKLNSDVAVVCKKEAGLMFGLDLMYENIEDDKENLTEFGIFVRKE